MFFLHAEPVNPNATHMASKVPKTALIKFTASWCGPCKAIAPFVDQLVDKYRIPFVVVDVDDDEETMRAFKVSAMPTLVFVKDGVELAELRVVGANRAAIEASAETFATALADTNQIDLPLDEAANVKKNGIGRP